MTLEGTMLSFQNLDAYKAAVDFAAFTQQLPDPIAESQTGTLERLRYAAMEIPIEVAWAAGEPKERARPAGFADARGAAIESAALLDVLFAFGVVDDALHRSGTELLGRLVAMLTKLIK
jgi:hypothetical protein